MIRLILLFLRPALDFGGVLGGIADIVGGSSLPHPSYFTPGGGPQADAAFLQALQAISSATDRNTGQIDPVLLHSYSQMLGIDLSGLISAGATSGDQYRQLATQAGTASAGLQTGANQILNQAFDPQNQLHDFLQQQTIDQSRGADSARGVAMSPYSSGNESTALRNFNLDWQNRQLGREITGAQGAQGAFGGAMDFGAAAPQYTMAGARAPIAGQAAAYSAPMDFSTQFLGAENAMFAPQAGVANLALPYINSASSAQANQFNQNLARSMDQTGLVAGGLDSIFGGGVGNPTQWFGYGGGNPFSQGSWGMGGGGGAGAGGLPTEQILGGSAPGYYGAGSSGVLAAGML